MFHDLGNCVAPETRPRYAIVSDAVFTVLMGDMDRCGCRHWRMMGRLVEEHIYAEFGNSDNQMQFK